MHRLADADLIDVCRRKLDLNDQRIAIRDDLHDRFPRRCEGTRCVNGELVDDAGLRCADMDALQFVLGGDQPLGKFTGTASCRRS